MKRTVYRTIYDEDRQKYMRFNTDSTCLVLEFTVDDGYGDGVEIYKSNHRNIMRTDIQKNNWPVCSKKEWNSAIARADAILKGKPIPELFFEPDEWHEKKESKRR